MSKLNFEEYNETPVIKKLKKSDSFENLTEKAKCGRKRKYATEEERQRARKEQQKEYRQRKKDEIEKLKQKIKELEGGNV